MNNSLASYGPIRRKGRLARPAGLTLVELLIALSVMVIIVGTLGAVAKTVQVGSEYSDGQGTAIQHGRVCLERITRTVNEATANESFPGFIVLAETVQTWRFPDTLVVWHPQGPPADPTGRPRFNELVIYCPNPERPNELLEITVPFDTGQVPGMEDEEEWEDELESIKSSSSSRKTVLTDLVRTAAVPEASGSMLRGVVRFEARVRPSDDDWNEYEEGDAEWEELPWVQGIYGSGTGLRQAWLRVELQLMPPTTAASKDPGAGQAIPLLGSAAVYYEMHR